MTARERILALRLLERQERNPDYAQRIGIQVHMAQNDPKAQKCKTYSFVPIPLTPKTLIVTAWDIKNSVLGGNILCMDLADTTEALEAPEDITEDPAAPALAADIITVPPWAVAGITGPRWAAAGITGLPIAEAAVAACFP